MAQTFSLPCGLMYFARDKLTSPEAPCILLEHQNQTQVDEATRIQLPPHVYPPDVPLRDGISAFI